MHRHADLASMWVVLILGVTGCGGEGTLDPQPVTGLVIVNGQPAAGCTVVFVPLDPSLKGHVMPGGITADDGTFEVTTHETGDGAPAGQYGVSLRWEAEEWAGMDEDTGMDPVKPEGPDRLQGAYSSPDKSGLSVLIVNGENNLQPFDLDDVALLPGSK